MEPQRVFQRRVGEVLQQGRSVLLVAPTGLGKTRAAVEPFTSGRGGPLVSTRLLYALPLRALAEGICRQLVEMATHNAGLNIPDGLSDLGELRRWLASATGMTVAVHTGEHPESMIFSEQACVTTSDQYLAAFAGAPLSSFTDSTTNWRVGRVKVGHAVAGAVLTSYSVFDEVHLLDPKNGLQLLMAVLAQRRRWGLLSTVSTATLPRSVIEYLTENEDGPRLELVTPSKEDIAARDDHRKVNLELALDAAGLSVEEVVRLCVQGFREHGKVILFANTVDRAIQYYVEVKAALNEEAGNRVMLIHSRFAPEDRRAKEAQVRAWFGEGSKERAVLVTTQVAEAGLNISSPLVLTELCPADSLVQRAGRCARFTSPGAVVEGRVVAFKPGAAPSDNSAEGASKKEHRYWLPYQEGVVRLTERALPSYQGLLTWNREQEFVTEALDELYGAWVRGMDVSEELDKKGLVQPPRRGRLRPVDALGPFERAFRAHSADELEQWLRNPEGRPLSVQVTVAESVPDALRGLRAFRHPVLVAVPFGVFRGSLEGKRVYEIDAAAARHGDGSGALAPVTSSQVRPGRSYLLLSSEAGYSAETGLTLQGDGAALGWVDLPPGERRQDEGRDQTFLEHACGAFERATRLTDLYVPFLHAWATAVLGGPVPPDEVAAWLADAMKAAALFHDVGKLQRRWQELAGWREGEEPIARFPYGSNAAKQEGTKLPHHAAFAYTFLQALFREAHGPAAYLRPLDFIALAAARHHTLSVGGAIGRGEFHPFDGERALAVLKEIARSSGLGIDEAWIDAAFQRIWKGEFYYADEAPSPSDDFYPIYCIAQRLVKVADWEDAGNRGIELKEQ